MKRDACPVCRTSLSSEQMGSRGDTDQFNCPRCGPFEITATALAMLHSRLASDNNSAARLSHAIRSAAVPEQWVQVTSVNLDEYIHRPLPSVKQQGRNFLEWAAAVVGDDRFGTIELPESDTLAGIVGTVNGARVDDLVRFLRQEGVIDHHYGNVISLTPKAWERLESFGERSTIPTERPNLSSEKIELAHCNTCHGERKAFTRASFTKKGSENVVQWSDTYTILECCGCGTLMVRHQHWFSEWDNFDQDPITGNPILVPGTETSYWPPITKRPKPAWIEEIEDKHLRIVLEEVYSALNMGLVNLSATGLRTAIDRATVLRVGDIGGFNKKLEAMVTAGFLGHEEKKTLEAMTDAGSAAAHRAYTPSEGQLNTMMDTVETFIYREFALKSKTETVRKATPLRSTS